MTITRTADTDDDGTGLTGTVHNNAWKTSLYDAIDTALGAQGTWTAWVPTWTNLTEGSATITARFNQIGTRVLFRLEIIWAGDTSASGNVSFSLPVNAAAASGAGSVLGTAVDTGTASYPVRGDIGTSTVALVCLQATVAGTPSTVNVIRTFVSDSVPFSWGNTDVLRVAGFYESA